MDTSDLTCMAYECLGLANDAADIMMTEAGALCSRFSTEDDYLRGLLEEVLDIEEDPRDYLDWCGMLETTDIDDFSRRVTTLREHIEKTLQTPIGERGERTKWWRS